MQSAAAKRERQNVCQYTSSPAVLAQNSQGLGSTEMSIVSISISTVLVTVFLFCFCPANTAAVPSPNLQGRASKKIYICPDCFVTNHQDKKGKKLDELSIFKYN